MRTTWKLYLSIVVFALCIGPTIISYRLYSFTWDDADYLTRSIVVSRTFWSGDRERGCVQGRCGSNQRSPVMTLLGLPWGALPASWDDAGKCLITLALLISFFAALTPVLASPHRRKPPLSDDQCRLCVRIPRPIPSDSYTRQMVTGLMADALPLRGAFLLRCSLYPTN